MQTRSGTAACGDIELFYEDLGDPADPPVLLIMGVGAQLPMWPDGFCGQLLKHGYRVIRFDHRDTGLHSVRSEIFTRTFPRCGVHEPFGDWATYADFVRLLEEAGMPPGVINLLTGDGREISEVLLADPALTGIHFTGSSATFQHLWQQVGSNIASYATYPRLVGETGGKDFVLAHPSADVDVLRTALVRGAFEYQGQKCSAASRAYVPRSLWSRLRDDLADLHLLQYWDTGKEAWRTKTGRYTLHVGGSVDTAVSDRFLVAGSR